MMRKNTRFRLYLAFLAGFYLLGVVFLLNRQAAAYQARMDRMEKDFERRFEDAKKTASANPEKKDVPEPVPDTSQAPVYDGPDYFVLGSGRCGKYGYLDIMFADSWRNRYYFRRDLRSARRDLHRMIQRIEQDSFFHRWQIGPDFSRASVLDDGY